jgi:predicted methyltransferase
MAFQRESDLREAVNAISDVIQNRPGPLRVFDQIYMKAGDMVAQSELVAAWADGKRLAFIGDGDAISVCVAYLKQRDVIDYGPTKITVFDFDERIVGAVTRFAEKERLGWLEAKLYNCFDGLPPGSRHDMFYTNPPWGASNDGVSVHVFAQRGMEVTGFEGEGMIVIADDADLEWPKRVLATTQAYCAHRGFYVSKMMPRMHEYHLDDAPTLRSCNLVVSAVPGNGPLQQATGALDDPQALTNFYGRSNELRVRYVRECKRLDYGKAHDDEYRFEMLSDPR